MSVARHHQRVCSVKTGFLRVRQPFARWLAAAAVILAELACAGLVAAQSDPSRVLALHSTPRDSQLSRLADSELPRALDVALGRRLDYYSEFVDAAPFGEPGYQAAFADFLRVKYRDTRFDVLIAMGDAALSLIANNTALFRGTPVVFMANDPAVRGGPNSTGVILERNFGASLPLMEALQPDLKEVFVVTGAGASDRALEELARTQFRRQATRLTFTYLAGLGTADLERRLGALPPRSAVFYVIVSEDGSGSRFHPLDYAGRVATAANAPTYCWVDSALGRGIVGGSLISLEDVIQRVAQLALRVLRGERAGSIPIARPELNAHRVDWRQLRRWGIAEARVPPGTLVSFREPGVWDRYRPYVLAAIAVLLLQSLLIAGLLIQRERRQRVERELRRRQSELQASYGRIRDLGVRLLNAQEAERARIAHELHDDISQQLSLLAIYLDMLRASVHGAGKALLDDASASAESIVSSVHDLSRRLHPYKLRLIGLVAALQDLQNAVSQAGIAITFTHEDVPVNLPQDLTLCLFRIVQEALQNALKHSHARAVSMRLIGSPAGLELTITDDGIGFDVDAAWGNGLGLVGMRERLDAIGGVFEIHSTPGVGTSLLVRVARTVFEDTKAPAPPDPVEKTPYIA